MNILLIFLVSLLYGCAGVQPAKPDYSTFNAHKPRSIVVVPVINETTEVSAPNVFASTITSPLAEYGYYVFPVYLTDIVLRDFGLVEAGHIHQLPTQRFYDLFGADAVLFVTIKDWSSKYLVLASSVIVNLEYVLKDTKTDTVLWKAEQQAVHNSSVGGGGIVGLAINLASAALNAAVTDYRPLAYRANYLALRAAKGIPVGPYHPEYGKDQTQTH